MPYETTRERFGIHIDGVITMRNKAVLSFLACLVLIAFLSGCGGALQATGFSIEPVSVVQDPVQTAPDNVQSILLKTKSGSYTIAPVAAYRVSAMVASKKNYSSGWNAEFSPCDLALAWGDLTKPEVMAHIHYSQSGRWYYYRYNAECPVSGGYIASHSSNHHIIPANDHVRRAALAIQRNDHVLLEGFLVNVDGTFKGRTVWWRSSLSRSDTGDGACELMYVTRIQIGNYFYE